MAGLCEQCRWWARWKQHGPDLPAEGVPSDTGTCQRWMRPEDRGKGPYYVQPADDTLMEPGGVGWEVDGAVLETKATFGCVMFEQKGAGDGEG